MTTSITNHFYAALFGIAVLSSCSRPVAYFQKGSVVAPTRANTQTVPTAIPDQTAALPVQPISEGEAYVRNDQNLVENKAIDGHLSRARQLLVASQEQEVAAPVKKSHKLNVVDRLIIRKLNKRIAHQLAPNQLYKTMINSMGQLIGGAVLLVGGLLLLILGTGTVAFIGLILSLVGALGVIVGLFGG
ncbi:hypothetical protein M0L20_26480 [Spirosoma sp. RP8]|uniref:Uncharacterized protein n=2 Tax=Spirosoma liriopis TaxID=2937440 RepID=A0ABT0HVA7_9BACT|nr:hypothetical protein [Spirosoma liriopis]